jgi:hypothetical protein
MTASHIDPLTLLTPKRLDLMCKYRFFKEMAHGYVLHDTAERYQNHILLRTGGKEPNDIWGHSHDKHSVDDFIVSAHRLFKSLKQNGFQEDNPIPYFVDKQLANGAHRLAASLALNIPVYAEQIEHEHRPPVWDFKWFVDQGFTLPDLLPLLYDYSALCHNRASVFVFYAPSEEHWPAFEDKIAEQYDIVGAVTLDLPTPQSMYELILDLYSHTTPHNIETPIGRKAEILSQAPLKLRVVLGDVKHYTDAQSLHDAAKYTKQACRDLADKTLAKETYLSIHASSSPTECLHMGQVLFSYNNLVHLVSRKTVPQRAEFLSWIENSKATCVEHQIPHHKICIVGSSPLEIMGVRQSTDIDFTVTSDIRARFGDGITKLNDHNDIVTNGYHRVTEGDSFTDDQLIAYPDLHFMFRGLKCANVQIVLERKSFSRRDKDVRDLQLYEEYITRDAEKFYVQDDFQTLYEREKQIRSQS